MSASVTVSLAVTKNNVSQSFAAAQTASMAAAGYAVQSPVIGTSVYQVSTATLSNLGYAYLRSLVTTTQTTCTITFGRFEGWHTSARHQTATRRAGLVSSNVWHLRRAGCRRGLSAVDCYRRGVTRG